MRTKEQNKNIDFSKFVDSDCVDMATDVIKGVHSLLNSKELTADGGNNFDKKWNDYFICTLLDRIFL